MLNSQFLLLHWRLRPKFFSLKTQKPKLKTVLLLLLLLLGLPGLSYGQANQCWTFNSATGTWVYNTACSQTPNAPLKVAVGKQLTVNNSLTLSGTDNSTLNVGTGGTLGTAAYANSIQFQPSGAATGLSSTASNSLTVGTGSATFNTSAGLAYASNMVVTAYYTSNVAIFMQGPVTSYNSTTGALVVNVTNTGGSGTYNAWTISISRPQGATGAQGGSGVPVGAIVAFGGSTAPANYLLCDGTQYTCSSYSSLCSVLGSTWGGNGTTTFNVPDLRGRFALGAGQGATAGERGSKE